MTWRDAFALEGKYGTGQFRERASELLSLSRLYRHALMSRDYSPARDFVDAVAVKAEGNEFVERARTTFSEAKPEDLTAAAFMAFYHQELWIDPEASDAETILRILSTEIRGNNIRYPWIFRHDLYDRFFSLYPPYTEKLSSVETDALLDGTPTGVFQVRDIIVPHIGDPTSIKSLCHQIVITIA
jgi:hypothetical protein